MTWLELEVFSFNYFSILCCRSTCGNSLSRCRRLIMVSKVSLACTEDLQVVFFLMWLVFNIVPIEVSYIGSVVAERSMWHLISDFCSNYLILEQKNDTYEKLNIKIRNWYSKYQTIFFSLSFCYQAYNICLLYIKLHFLMYKILNSQVVFSSMIMSFLFLLLLFRWTLLNLNMVL
jgi:hypothetical protein